MDFSFPLFKIEQSQTKGPAPLIFDSISITKLVWRVG